MSRQCLLRSGSGKAGFVATICWTSCGCRIQVSSDTLIKSGNQLAMGQCGTKTTASAGCRREMRASGARSCTAGSLHWWTWRSGPPQPRGRSGRRRASRFCRAGARVDLREHSPPKGHQLMRLAYAPVDDRSDDLVVGDELQTQCILHMLVEKLETEPHSAQLFLADVDGGNTFCGAHFCFFHAGLSLCSRRMKHSVNPPQARAKRE
eukprot:m.175347 g.175347  ORF g.175347 m.175347 type:complete len:207 (+) comp53316_c0_seq21:888-1508(+)